MLMDENKPISFIHHRMLLFWVQNATRKVCESSIGIDSKQFLSPINCLFKKMVITADLSWTSVCLHVFVNVHQLLHVRVLRCFSHQKVSYQGTWTWFVSPDKRIHRRQSMLVLQNPTCLNSSDFSLSLLRNVT